MAIMAQVGSPATAPPNSNVAHIFRRRLGLPPLSGAEGPRGPGPVKCLFGAPDETVCTSMSQKVEAKHQWSFSKKWNFNITGKEPPPITMQSSDTDSKVSRHEWTESYNEEYMWKCDRNRFEAPIAPNARPYTLLYAPTTMEPSSTILNEATIAVPENLVMSTTPTSTEHASVQTEMEAQEHKGMQVDLQDIIGDRKPKSEMTLNHVFSISVTDDSSPDESQSTLSTTTTGIQFRRSNMKLLSPLPPVKKERPLLIPLTIPPVSPLPPGEFHEEYEGEDHYDVDEAFSPLPDKTVFSNNRPVMSPCVEDILKTPPNRRNSIAVFNFESPSNSLRCLRIRNGSPVRSHSASKIMKQRVITDYVQVKKGGYKQIQ